MDTFTDIHSLQSYLSPFRKKSFGIGLVPTMGALHNGHLALIKQSLLENEITACSIFVNPIQFNRKEDLNSYPRVLDKDLKLLDDLGCDVVFLPVESDMYPKEPILSTEMGYMDNIMEGKHRPGHFNGVRLIVLKLLNIIRPDCAYFGKKDLQQFTIIKTMAEILNIGTEIKGVDTIREARRAGHVLKKYAAQ